MTVARERIAYKGHAYGVAIRVTNVEEFKPALSALLGAIAGECGFITLISIGGFVDGSGGIGFSNRGSFNALTFLSNPVFPWEKYGLTRRDALELLHQHRGPHRWLEAFGEFHASDNRRLDDEALEAQEIRNEFLSAGAFARDISFRHVSCLKRLMPDGIYAVIRKNVIEGA